MVPIRMDNLRKRYVTAHGAVAAVEGVTLEIAAGELFFLLGPSGCGKTTLLRMLAGFLIPDSGRVFFGPRDVTDLAPEDRQCAMVFQNYALWPHMTVAKNVGFGPKVRGVGRGERERIVDEMLRTVRIAEKASAKPLELSGGQQQRVALARALAARPNCLLLDEPLSNLDAALRADMRWEIRRIVKAAGATGVYVTHDQAEALAIADRIALMKDGRIVQVGTGRELYEAPADRFVAKFLGEANFLPATVVAHDGSALVLDTPLGRLASDALGSTGYKPVLPKVGDKLTCCIRPEALRVVAAGEQAGPGYNVFTAKLLEWIPLGDCARFRVRAGAVELSGSAMPARPVAQAGADVQIAISPRDIAVLKE